MTKRELKAIVRRVLLCEYGYAPTYREITILESNEYGQWIEFSIGTHVYSWDSVTLEKR